MDDLDGPGEPPDPPQRCRLELLDPESRLSAGQGAWVCDCAERAMGELGASGELRVRVVGDAEMAMLHERDAGVAGTTDVLTYDLGGELSEELAGELDGGGGERRELDADIVVCFDEAARLAGERGVAVERELLLYVLHGALHCLGHDDHSREGYERMHALEDEVLEAIGVGATFSLPPGGRS